MSSHRVIRFGAFEMNLRTSEVRKHGIRIRLQEQPFQVLAALAGRPGELVSREELRRKVWPEDTFVDFDHALNTAVKKIRGALNDDADAPRYVETVPRRGYRFIAPVEPVNGQDRDAPAPGETERPAVHRSAYLPRAVLAATLLAALASAALFYVARRTARAGAAPPSGRVMVAVLPFQNMSSDSSQEYFSDGMTEETIAQLGQLNPERFGVIARTSAMKYKHANKTVAEIGKELNVEYVLEGSIRREGQRVRIAAQLIRASDQSPRWAQDFDRDLSDALALQSEVARAIAGSIDGELGRSMRMAPPPVSKGPVDAAAYDRYLQGRHATDESTTDGIRRGIAAFQQAIAKDPTCAINWAGLASAYGRAGGMAMLPPAEASAKAKEAALRAIALDPRYPSAHVSLAEAVLADWSWEKAEKEIQEALRLNPNDAQAHEWYGLYLLLLGRYPGALHETQRAWQLDPVSPDRMLAVGRAHYLLGRTREAVRMGRMALELDPSSAGAHRLLARIYEEQGNSDEAIAHWHEFYLLRGETAAAAALKRNYPAAGYAAVKQAALREDIAYWKEARASRYVPAWRLVAAYAQLGDREQTMQWLLKAEQEKDASVLSVRSQKESEFACVKDDPRFAALVERIRYPQ